MEFQDRLIEVEEAIPAFSPVTWPTLLSALATTLPPRDRQTMASVNSSAIHLLCTRDM